MRKVLKRMRPMLAALATGALLWCGAPAVQAMDEIMPLSELEEGMTGELYTVVDSSGDIRSFEVTILGVMRNGKSMPFIMARSEGAFADTDGGLMQGMSGSPVYVDGRLIGAGSATLKEMNPHTFLITPIEEMLPIWDMPDTKAKGRSSVVDLKKAQDKEAEEKKDDGTAPKEPKDGKSSDGKDKADDKGKKDDSAEKVSPQKTESASPESGKDSSAKEKESSPSKDEEKPSKPSEAKESKDAKDEGKPSRPSEAKESKDAKDEEKLSKGSEAKEEKSADAKESADKGGK